MGRIVDNVYLIAAVGAVAGFAVFTRRHPGDVYTLSRVAKVAMIPVVIGGIALVVYAHRHPTDDGQGALVIPGIVLAALMAAAAVWVLDVLVRVARRHRPTPS